jgi:diguanylate cyclase (GGDEF)-like protein
MVSGQESKPDRDRSTRERLPARERDGDSVTGLPGRIALDRLLTDTLSRRQQAADILAVICIDIDRFKTFNDSLGNVWGDRLLYNVGQRLQQQLAPQMTIARWGADEFTIIAPNLASIAAVEKVAERVLACFDLPLEFDEILPRLESKQLKIKVSMGIAIAPIDGDDSQVLLERADAAMHSSTALGGQNNYEFYTDTISDSSNQKLKIESILDRAIELDRFFLEYQPQLDTKIDRIVGAEALLRCYDREGKRLDPADFIPIAEETGSIAQIGEWAILEACRQNKEWQDRGLGFFPVAVNISLRQLQQAQTLDAIVDILARTGLSPEYLEIEITESTAIDNLDTIVATLDALRRIGIKIALDDFGTGYSSLASLKCLPFDILKVDRFFITDLIDSPVDIGIVKTIIYLAQQLNLQAIAEGVETREQLAFLESVGCHVYQGFLFSRPISGADFSELLAARQ